MSRRELDLEGALADLAAAIEFPPTPDLAGAVATRLAEAPAPGATPARARRRDRLAGLGRLAGWRRLAVVGLAAVLLAAAVLVASPGTREAVARRLGLRGVGVELGGPPPPTATSTPGARLDLGLGQRVYRARPGLPASPFTDVGLLVTEFRGQPTPDFIKKTAVLGQVEEVTVAGQP